MSAVKTRLDSFDQYVKKQKMTVDELRKTASMSELSVRDDLTSQ